jgi:hypothetical protein
LPHMHSSGDMSVTDCSSGTTNHPGTPRASIVWESTKSIA